MLYSKDGINSRIHLQIPAKEFVDKVDIINEVLKFCALYFA